MLPQLVFVWEGHQAAFLLEERAWEDTSTLRVLRRYMPCQVVLPLESIVALCARVRSTVLVHRLDVRHQLTSLCESCLALRALLHCRATRATTISPWHW